MSDNSSIEWTDATWNPLVGCERISPGCAHCYAKTQHDVRHKAVLAGKRLPVQYQQPFETLQLRPDRLEQPLHWKKPRRVFVNSLSDLFHQDVPDDFIDKVFAVMALAKRHTFQILTKRPARMCAYFEHFGLRQELIGIEAERISGFDRYDVSGIGARWKLPLPNVWLGVSVETQHFADKRIPLLLQTPAAVRFISAEPLLGPVRLQMAKFCDAPTAADSVSMRRLDWVIVGGESGPKSRPFDIAWARSIVTQCAAAGVPCFVKQMGSCITGLNLDGPPFSSPPRREGFLVHWSCREDNTFGLCDRKGGDPSEWPEDLRVRQFPEPRV